MPDTQGFLNQLDYIYFVYGLAFVALGTVCLIRHRARKGRLPWWLLAAFGFAHGLNEWLELLALTAGDSSILSALRLAIMAASFGFLVEFGRIGTSRLGMRAIGPWVAPSLLLVALLLGGMVGSLVGLNVGIRYTLGLVGCLWSALALVARGRECGVARRRLLLFAGISMLLYGLAAGALVPKVDAFPANILNHESFLTAVGLPVQFIRTLLACCLTVAVWVDDLSRFAGTTLIKKRLWYYLASIGIMGLVVATGWMFTNYLGSLYIEDMRHDLNADTSLLVEGLSVDTTLTKGLVKAMATSVDVAKDSAGQLRAAKAIDQLVDRFSVVHPGLVAYVMDRSGTVIAASNRSLPTSFAGKNYSFRPYFRDALAERPGEHFALGVTSGEAGFYASAPIRDRDQAIIGVAVIKHTLTAATMGLAAFHEAFLIDAQGIVLVAGYQEAPYSLWLLPPELLRQARAAHPVTGAAISPLSNRRLEDGDWIKVAGKNFLVSRQVVNGEGWSMVVLRPEKASLVNRVLGIVVTLLVSTLVLSALAVVQRELGVEVLMHQNQLRLEELSQELEQKATTDVLTGVMNRLKLNEVLHHQIAYAARYQTPLSLIMLDVDHFKQVNDRYGHQSGDGVLVALARLVASHIRETDALARWGGEEFMIVAPQLKVSGAAEMADKLRKLVESASFGETGRQTCSFGVTQFMKDDTADTLTSRADQALYKAKAGGRNRVECA